jgi:hypothetical protein
MKWTIIPYDDALKNITTPLVQAFAVDRDGQNLTPLAVNRSLGSGYGIELDLRISKPFSACMEDTGGIYASAALGDLNGGVTSQLDVILYTLPSPAALGGGPQIQPTNVEDLTRFIHAQVKTGQWTPAEGRAVRSLSNAVLTMSGLSAPTETVKLALNRWSKLLRQLGIDIRSLAEAQLVIRTRVATA